MGQYTIPGGGALKIEFTTEIYSFMFRGQGWGAGISLVSYINGYNSKTGSHGYVVKGGSVVMARGNTGNIIYVINKNATNTCILDIQEEYNKSTFTFEIISDYTTLSDYTELE